MTVVGSRDTVCPQQGQSDGGKPVWRAVSPLRERGWPKAMPSTILRIQA